jgi:hypothetical protein
MCAYAHPGGLAVQRWIAPDSIQPNYSREESLEVMKTAEFFASLSVMGLAGLASDENLERRAWEAFQQRKAEYASQAPRGS